MKAIRRRWMIHVTAPVVVVGVAVAVIVLWIIPVPDALVAPIIMGAEILTGSVAMRRLARLDSGGGVP